MCGISYFKTLIYLIDLNDTEYDLWNKYRHEKELPEECSTACTKDMRGNSVCDMVCNNGDCQYDDGDCLGKRGEIYF